MLGDPRTNQNPAFLALGIVFYRWHNLQAAKIQEVHPDWDDEDIFQAARRRVIATLQVSNRPRIIQFFKGLIRLALADPGPLELGGVRGVVIGMTDIFEAVRW